MEESTHERHGAVGAFAEFIDDCRRGVLRDGRTTFGAIRYGNHTPDRTMPLHRCTIDKLDAGGMFLYATWNEVEIRRSADLRHLAGTAVWTRVSLRHAKLDSCRARLVSAYSTFDHCDFSWSNLIDPLFIQCTFINVQFKRLNLVRPSFVDCVFDRVDVNESSWESPNEIEIRGTWTGELSADSDPKSKALFAHSMSSLP